jgi:hypothetical protein
MTKRTLTEEELERLDAAYKSHMDGPDAQFIFEVMEAVKRRQLAYTDYVLKTVGLKGSDGSGK